MLYDLGTLNLRQLAEHLGAIDPRTARAFAEKNRLPLMRVSEKAPVYIAWADVFRCLHGIEPAHHGDILTELKEPLVTIQSFAASLNITAEALKRREKRGRVVLPVPALTINEMTRLWRPRDVRAWQMGGAVTAYRRVGEIVETSVKPEPIEPAKTAGRRAANALGLGGLRSGDALQAVSRGSTGTASAPA